MKVEYAIPLTLKFGSTDIIVNIAHKHLCVIIDYRLDFQNHVKEAIVKARRGIGMIKYLSRHVFKLVPKGIRCCQ